MKDPTARQRKSLNKNKIKEPVIYKPKEKETVICPIKNVNIYKWVCIDKCTYFKKCKIWKEE